MSLLTLTIPKSTKTEWMCGMLMGSEQKWHCYGLTWGLDVPIFVLSQRNLPLNHSTVMDRGGFRICFGECVSGIRVNCPSSENYQ